MARLEVVTGILNRFGPMVDEVRTWTDSAGQEVVVVGPNETGDADPAGGRFISVQFPVANEKQITIGAPGQNVWREEGVCRVTIAARRNNGTVQALTWAKEIAALFRGKQFDGVVCWGVSSPQMDDRNDEGGYYRVPLNIGYEHDLFG